MIDASAFSRAPSIGLVTSLNTGAESWGRLSFDADAELYIKMVEYADGSALEYGVKEAFNNFIRGLKADNQWSAMQNSCILIGARTLAGALTPLRGVAPTPENLVEADYNRKTGIAGNASNKAINTNRSCIDELDRNAIHQAVGITVRDFTAGRQMCGWGGYTINGSTLIEQGNTGNNITFHYCNNATSLGITTSATLVGLFGVRKISGNVYSTIAPSGSLNTSAVSQAASGSGNYRVLAGTSPGGAGRSYSSNRASFYSFGSTGASLFLLRSRYNLLIQEITNAIL